MNPIRYLRRLATDVSEARSGTVATSETVARLVALMESKLSALTAAVVTSSQSRNARLVELTNNLNAVASRVAKSEDVANLAALIDARLTALNEMAGSLGERRDTHLSEAERSDRPKEQPVPLRPELAAVQQKPDMSTAVAIEPQKGPTAPRKNWLDETNPADFYKENGYYIFRQGLEKTAVERLVKELDQEVVQSEGEFFRHYGGFSSHDYIQDTEGNKFIRNAIMDPHRQEETPRVARAIRELICTEELADQLQSIDDALAHTIHQTLIFFTSPGTDLHFDGWGLDSCPFGYSHTLWIPLEAVTLLNGPLAIVPWTVGRFLSPDELGFGKNFLEQEDAGNREDYEEYCRRYDAYIRRHHPNSIVPQLEPGDIVMFSSLTPHRTMPPSQRSPSRRAMQILLRDSSRNWASWPQLLREQRANLPDEPGDRLDTVSARWRMVM